MGSAEKMRGRRSAVLLVPVVVFVGIAVFFGIGLTRDPHVDQTPSIVGNGGPFAITFTSPNAATLQLPGGRLTTIWPEAW